MILSTFFLLFLGKFLEKTSNSSSLSSKLTLLPLPQPKILQIPAKTRAMALFRVIFFFYLQPTVSSKTRAPSFFPLKSPKELLNLTQKSNFFSSFQGMLSLIISISSLMIKLLHKPQSIKPCLKNKNLINSSDRALPRSLTQIIIY